MSECMGSDKPLIAILMAVYEPRMDWLREQLLSLEKQTYPRLKLYIRDDCSPTVPMSEIAACVRECIHSFPFEIRQNEENLGSNRTFERLTEEAEGEYFAYCDQDDVWLPEKLEVLQEELERSGALLVCSDMIIIDGDGKKTADSITKVRKRHRFLSGEGLVKELLIRNFVTGCTMMIRAESAKKSLPFCLWMVHDHYLALWCAKQGKIRSLPERLICYRIHGGNQTSLLSGISSKEGYYQKRILPFYQCTRELHERFPDIEMSRVLKWASARKENYMRKKCAIKILWKYRKENYMTTVFEIVMFRIPDAIFRAGIKFIQLGII